MIELRTTMPASAIMPIIAVAVNHTGSRQPPTVAPATRLRSQKPGAMPITPSGIASMMTSGRVSERVSITSSTQMPTSAAANAAEVAEDVDRDLPFPLAGPAGTKARGEAVGARSFHGEGDVGGRPPGDVADHVDHPLEVLVVDRLLRRTRDERAELGERHEVAARAAHPQLAELGRPAALRAAEAHDELERRALLRFVDGGGVGAGEREAQRARDLDRGDAVERGLLLVEHEVEAGMRGLAEIVDVHHAGLAREA